MSQWTGKQTAQEHQSQSGMGERIRQARQTAGLTQVELANAVGVSRSAIAQWETDRSGQVGVNLARLAVVLSVSPTYLLNGSVGQDGGGTAESPQEMALLRLYREMGDEDRQVMLRLAIRLSRTKNPEI